MELKAVIWRKFLKKLNSYISIFFFVFIVGFISLIVYVSLLGDNHKINFAVEQYFTDIKNRTFDTPCADIKSENILQVEECRNKFFLLETALLSKYNLLGAKDYSVEIKRNHFWIPFITDDTILISVAFIPKRENFFKSFVNKKNIVYVENLLTVKKENKLWQVQKIDLDSTSLAPVFNKLRKEINLNTYVIKTEKGYILNNVEIDFDKLSPLKRRLFEYSLNKLSAL